MDIFYVINNTTFFGWILQIYSSYHKLLNSQHSTSITADSDIYQCFHSPSYIIENKDSNNYYGKVCYLILKKYMYYKKYFTQFKSSYKTAKIKTTNVDII